MEDQILEKKTIENNPAENKSVNYIQQNNEIKSLYKYDIIVFGPLGFTEQFIIMEIANLSQIYNFT